MCVMQSNYMNIVGTHSKFSINKVDYVYTIIFLYKYICMYVCMHVCIYVYIY